jgi:hypothetical protein
MKRAKMALAISFGLFFAGFLICRPGICGCASWFGSENLGIAGLLVAGAGALGIIVSACWLTVAAIRAGVRRKADSNARGS